MSGRRCMRWAAAAACLGLGACASWPMTGRAARTQDAEAVSAMLDAMERAIERHSIYEALGCVSRAYRDAEGRDYSALRSHLSALLDQYGEIAITRTRSEIAVTGKTARAVETFRTTGVPRAGVECPPMDVEGEVTIRLAKERGAWRVTEWSRLR